MFEQCAKRMFIENFYLKIENRNEKYRIPLRGTHFFGYFKTNSKFSFAFSHVKIRVKILIAIVTKRKDKSNYTVFVWKFVNGGEKKILNYVYGPKYQLISNASGDSHTSETNETIGFRCYFFFLQRKLILLLMAAGNVIRVHYSKIYIKKIFTCNLCQTQ